MPVMMASLAPSGAITAPSGALIRTAMLGLDARVRLCPLCGWMDSPLCCEHDLFSRLRPAGAWQPYVRMLLTVTHATTVHACMCFDIRTARHSNGRQVGSSDDQPYLVLSFNSSMDTWHVLVSGVANTISLLGALPCWSLLAAVCC